MAAIPSNYTLLYEVDKYNDLKFEINDDASFTMTFPRSGTLYIESDGTIQLISYKQDAINEIKEQPFF